MPIIQFECETCRALFEYGARINTTTFDTLTDAVAHLTTETFPHTIRAVIAPDPPTKDRMQE